MREHRLEVLNDEVRLVGIVLTDLQPALGGGQVQVDGVAGRGHWDPAIVDVLELLLVAVVLLLLVVVLVVLVVVMIVVVLVLVAVVLVLVAAIAAAVAAAMVVYGHTLFDPSVVFEKLHHCISGDQAS